MKYAETRYWSVIHDAEVARLSIANDHGEEFFAIVPITRPWSEARIDALDGIWSAMQDGCEPGEVAL